MKKLFCLLVTVLIVAASFGPAEARRRIRIPFFIGGGGSSETIILVQDLPNKRELQRDANTYIDLGYKFSPEGDRWIGYIGSSTRYVPLSDAQLKRIMAVAGLKELPPVPSMPASMFFEDMFGLLILVLIAGGALAVLVGKFMTRNRVDEDDIEAYAKNLMMQQQTRDRRIEDQIQARMTGGAVPIRPAAPTQSFAPRPAATGPVTFGKRA